MIIMQITNTFNANSNISARVAPATATNETATYTPNATQQNNVAATELAVNQIAIIDHATAMRYEISELLQQFSEWMRVASESRRMEFLYNILLKESYGESDLFGKIMDIARRIMRNEDVTPEEMRFLAEHNPRLLYVVTILKEDTTDNGGKERRRARDRRGKDRRSVSRRRDHVFRSQQSSEPPEPRIIERRNHNVPRELVKQINSLLVDKSIKNSYGISLKKKRHLSISINTVITNPHDIAT